MKYTIATAAIIVGMGLTSYGDNSAQNAMYNSEQQPGQMQHQVAGPPSGSDHPGIVSRAKSDTASVAKDTWHDSTRIASEGYHGSKNFAAATWDESKRIGRTIVDSPVIAYQVVRGERPLFRHDTASRTERTRESVAMGGHKKSAIEKDTTQHAQPPI